jgi:hypothetical protein
VSAEIVAIIATYNESDIIEQVLGNLIDQDIRVYLLDDGSTDATVDIAERFLGRGVIAVERFRDPACGASTAFALERILHRKSELARTLDAGWFINHDADEFRESPWAGVSLAAGIRRVDALGFNAIDFAGLDFWPVHDRFLPGEDVRQAFRFYKEAADYDRIQIRCWKKADDIELVSTGGHDARFNGRNVFPIRFLLRHYPIRGQAHGVRKILDERRPRFVQEERARGWHVQYDEVVAGGSFIRDPSTLVAYDPDAVRVALTLRHRGVEALEQDVDSLRCLADQDRRLIAALREQLAAAAAELAERAAEAEALRGEIERQWQDLDARRRQLDGCAADLAGHRAEVANLRAALIARDAEVDRWRAVVDSCERQMDRFSRSLSWRWTAPARAVYRALRGR